MATRHSRTLCRFRLEIGLHRRLSRPAFLLCSASPRPSLNWRLSSDLRPFARSWEDRPPPQQYRQPWPTAAFRRSRPPRLPPAPWRAGAFRWTLSLWQSAGLRSSHLHHQRLRSAGAPCSFTTSGLLSVSSLMLILAVASRFKSAYIYKVLAKKRTGSAQRERQG